METNCFLNLTLEKIFYLDSECKFEEANNLELEYEKIALIKSDKYLSYKWFKNEYNISQLKNNWEIVTYSNFDNILKQYRKLEDVYGAKLSEVFETAVLSECEYIKANFPDLNVKNIGASTFYLFQDGTISPLLPKHYMLERHILMKFGINPHLINQDILIIPNLTGAIRIGNKDVIFYRKPTQKQNEWLIKNPLRRYFINDSSNFFDSYTDPDLDIALKKISYLAAYNFHNCYN